MKKNRITIIGGGIAGISAAIHLIEKGHKVSVIEAKNFIGGRAGSIKSEETFIDIGQHAVSYTHLTLPTILLV